jgi:hypothetical protein
MGSRALQEPQPFIGSLGETEPEKPQPPPKPEPKPRPPIHAAGFIGRFDD